MTPNDPSNDPPNDQIYIIIYITKFTPQHIHHKIYTTKFTPRILHHEIYTTTFTPQHLHHEIYTTDITEFTAVWGLTLESFAKFLRQCTVQPCLKRKSATFPQKVDHKRLLNNSLSAVYDGLKF